MESETISTDILNEDNLKTTQLIKIKHFPAIVSKTESNSKMEHKFRISQRFRGRFMFYPLGAKTPGTNISMALEIESDNSYEYYGNVNMSILGADDKNYFSTKSLWAVYDGAPIQELLEAKYLIGGVLRIQIDIYLNCVHIANAQDKLYRGYLRQMIRSGISGDTIIRIQDHFDFYVDDYVMCQYYKNCNSIRIGKDTRKRPIYVVPRTDPYIFQWSLIESYMLEAKLIRGNRE